MMGGRSADYGGPAIPGRVPNVLPEPQVLHGRLARLFIPHVQRQAADARVALDADIASGVADVHIGEHEYSRFPALERIDWRPSFERSNATIYYMPTVRPSLSKRVPVCDDAEFSGRLAATMTALLDEINTWADNDTITDLTVSFANNERDAQTLTIATVLGYANAAGGGDRGLALALVRTLEVSTAAVAQSLAQLAWYPIKGFRDRAELAEAIVRDGVLDEFASLLPPNFVQPSCRDGLIFPGPLVTREADGTAALHPQARAMLEREKAAYIDMQNHRVDARAEGRGQVGSGCPLALHSAVHDSGITEIARVFMERFRVQRFTVETERRAPGPGARSARGGIDL